LRTPDKSPLFEQLVLPHLDAAYNLARWLLRNDQDAQDIVQEATLRAYRFIHDFQGTDARGWLLTIVRNCAYSWLRRQRTGGVMMEFNEELHSMNVAMPFENHASRAGNPETLVIRQRETQRIRAAIENLAVEFREVVVLRDIEGLSYKEIAEIAGVPMGTVMSRLARGRQQLQQQLCEPLNEDG
jgi:RNA polymerase sigma-70 factor (ECF subfamily)